MGTHANSSGRQRVARRAFLRAGLGAVALPWLLARDGVAQLAPGNVHAPGGTHHAPRARAIIQLHMAGGPSQLDLFDPKPALTRLHGTRAPAELSDGERFAFQKPDATLLGSPYAFARHGDSGQAFSELLPHMAARADRWTRVASMQTTQFNHAPAQLLMASGFERPGRPSFGAWTSWGLGSANDDLPAYVVLLSGDYGPSGGATLWGSGFLPTQHQGVQLRGDGDPVLFLSDPPGLTRAARRRMLDGVRALDTLEAARSGDPEIDTRIAQYELAWRMQSSVPELLRLDAEPREVLELYGADPAVGSFARNCLLARRLVERGVRFVQLYHWGWDSHGSNANDDLLGSLPARCRETDRASAALLDDLARTGLLDETLLVWGGEFGRTPMNEERDGSTYLGRDHNQRAFTTLLAGGGFRPGLVHGETDELGWSAARDPVSVHDLHATLLHQLGLDHERLTFRSQGRDYRLTDVHGRVVRELLG